ncbi:MAG: hypothetical protein ACLQPH_12955 [Acidimicrobiales bacterium]
MPDPAVHGVDPLDEHRHEPGPEPLWNESYYLDFVSADGTFGGYARIGLYPNLGVTWWTTMVVGAGRPVTASVAYDLPVAGGSGLELDQRGFAVRGAVIDPLRTMRLSGAAPAAEHDEPAAVYRKEPGRPTTVGFDLTWVTDGVPYHYDVTTRYEVPCLVRGEVTVGDDRVAVDGQGQRDHSWGVRDWWAFGWCWAAARLDDGTRVHVADIRMPGHPLGLGYVQPPGGGVLPVRRLAVSEVLGADGLPSSGRIELDPGGFDFSVEPVAFGPVLLESPDGRASRFPRALARFVARDGRTGTGWIEWNQPDPEVAAR